MNYLKLLLAFGLGWMVVILVCLVGDALAQRGGTSQSSLQARIAVLEERIRKLEQASANGKLIKKFAAPFEVVDAKEKRIFYVGSDREVEFYRQGKRLAGMSADDGIGTLWARSADFKSMMSLNGERLTAKENDQLRMELGRSPTKGNYRLIFYSADGKQVAGIGEVPETKAGLVFVSDASGNTRAKVGVTREDTGSVEIWGGTNLIAQITESRNKAGYFSICSPNGCSPPMVEAGDAGGFGVVRTGPTLYSPGVGLMGVPGSFLRGKHN